MEDWNILKILENIFEKEIKRSIVFKVYNPNENNITIIIYITHLVVIVQ